MNTGLAVPDVEGYAEIRDGACGGIAWYNPKTGEAGGFWKPLSNHQVTRMATASNGRTLVISTRRVDDPVLGKPKPDQGTLFFFDQVSGGLLRSTPATPRNTTWLQRQSGYCPRGYGTW